MILIDQGHRRIAARLDTTRLQVLALLHDAAGPLRPVDISQQLQLTKSTVSRQLTTLQEAGHLNVGADPRDGRTFLVEISSAGRHELTAARELGTAQFAKAITHWSDAQVDEARRSFRRLLAAWDRPNAPDQRPLDPRAGRGGEPRWVRRRLTDRPAPDREQT